LADIKYVITVDSAGALKNVQNFDKAVEDLGKTTGGKTAPAFSALWKQFAIGQLAVQALRDGWRLFKDQVGDSIKAAIEAESVDKALDATLDITGRKVADLADHFKEYASELQRKTIYDDEAIKKTQALLLQLTHLDRDGIDRATRGTIGLASALGIDLNSAATMVVKAMEGNYQALGRYGIKVRETGTLEEKRADLLEKIEKMFGRATAEAQTFGGQLSQLKNNWGEVQEAAGKWVTQQKGVIEILNKASQTLLDYLTMADMLDKATRSQVEQENRLADRLGKAAAAANWQYGEMAKLITAYHGNFAALIGAINAEKHGTEIKQAYIAALRAEKVEWQALEIRRKAAEGGTIDMGAAVEAERKKFHDLQMQLMATHRAAKELANVPFISWSGDIPPEKQIFWLTKLPPAINRVELVIRSLGLASANTGQKMKKTWSETAQEIAETMETIKAKTSEAFGMLNAIFDQSQRNREIAIENEYKKRLAFIEANYQDEEAKQSAILALEAEYEIKRTSAKRAAAKQQKAIALMEAMVNTADAITKALAQGGFVLGIPWAAIVGALGAAQIAMIAAQPIPLAKGGYFKEPTLMPGRDGRTYLGGDAGPEIVSPVAMMRDIVRDELRAFGGGRTLSIAAIHIHVAQTTTAADIRRLGPAVYGAVKDEFRLRGYNLEKR
jgi:hypothetical protein